jgi:hypothetical protein
MEPETLAMMGLGWREQEEEALKDVSRLVMLALSLPVKAPPSNMLVRLLAVLRWLVLS